MNDILTPLWMCFNVAGYMLVLKWTSGAVV